MTANIKLISFPFSCSVGDMTEDLQHEATKYIPYSSQARAMAMPVLNYLKNPLLNETELTIETAEATGISVSSAKRFKRKVKVDGNSSPPPKKIRKSAVLDMLEGFDKDCIRRIITSFYERGEIPTIDKVLGKVKEEPLEFSWGKVISSQTNQENGFSLKKKKSGKWPAHTSRAR